MVTVWGHAKKAGQMDHDGPWAVKVESGSGVGVEIFSQLGNFEGALLAISTQHRKQTMRGRVTTVPQFPAAAIRSFVTGTRDDRERREGQGKTDAKDACRRGI